MLLAIDTATDYGSVAIGEPGRIKAERVFSDRTHAARLVPAIQEVLEETGSSISDLLGLIVSDGPGSFTGVRIGFATTKGILCSNKELRMFTTPSLMASAHGVSGLADGPVAAMFDALRGDVFAAVYSFSGIEVQCHLEPQIGRTGEIAAKCSEKPAVAVGDGAIHQLDAVWDWTGREPLGPPEYFPRAASLIELYGLEGGTQLIESPESFEPTYGRLAEAEARRKRARAAGSDEK